MIIQVVGPGCEKCKKLEENTHSAVLKTGIGAEVQKVTDIDEMMELGVLASPGLVIDGEVQSFGKVLSVSQIGAFLHKKSL